MLFLLLVLFAAPTFAALPQCASGEQLVCPKFSRGGCDGGHTGNYYLHKTNVPAAGELAWIKTPAYAEFELGPLPCIERCDAQAGCDAILMNEAGYGKDCILLDSSKCKYKGSQWVMRKMADCACEAVPAAEAAVSEWSAPEFTGECNVETCTRPARKTCVLTAGDYTTVPHRGCSGAARDGKLEDSHRASHGTTWRERNDAGEGWGSGFGFQLFDNGVRDSTTGRHKEGNFFGKGSQDAKAACNLVPECGGFDDYNNSGTQFTLCRRKDIDPFEYYGPMVGSLGFNQGNVYEKPALDCTGGDGYYMEEDLPCEGVPACDVSAGCTDDAANNHDADANEDDGSCRYDGCTQLAADNFDVDATDDDGSCIISGCTDPEAKNYHPVATDDDGSCEAACKECDSLTKKECKKAKDMDTCSACAFVDGACGAAYCSDFTADGAKKCGKNGGKVGLECFWNPLEDPAVCTDEEVDVPCAAYKAKGECKKAGKAQGCFWAGKGCAEEGAEVPCDALKKSKCKGEKCGLSSQNKCSARSDFGRCSEVNKKSCGDFQVDGGDCVIGSDKKCGNLVIVGDDRCAQFDGTPGKCKKDTTCEWTPKGQKCTTAP